jgi:hypothetical protein
MILKLIGKARVAVKKTYEVTNLGFKRTADIDVVDEERVTLPQLQAYVAGQGIFQAAGVTRLLRSFYMGADLEKNRPKDFRVNRFLQVAPPSAEEIETTSMPIGADQSAFQKGLDLINKLKAPGTIDLHQYIQPDPVIAAISQCAADIPEHMEPHERGIMLYLAAAKALRVLKAKQDGQEDALQAHGQQEQQEIAQSEPSNPDLEDVDDVLGALLRPVPFERKPADQVLGDVPNTMQIRKKAEQPEPLSSAIKTAIMDPMETLLRNGRTLNLGIPEEGNSAIWRPVKFPPPAEEDWIETGLQGAAEMLKLPRSSDNTVIGFTGETLKRVEQVEGILGNDNPLQSAKVLERVVSVQITPDTQSKAPIDKVDIDAFFQTIEDEFNS